jgi:hypothetical protein
MFNSKKIHDNSASGGLMTKIGVTKCYEKVYVCKGPVGDEIKANGMGESCSTHGKMQKYIQNFGRKS